MRIPALQVNEDGSIATYESCQIKQRNITGFAAKTGYCEMYESGTLELFQGFTMPAIYAPSDTCMPITVTPHNFRAMAACWALRRMCDDGTLPPEHRAKIPFVYEALIFKQAS